MVSKARFIKQFLQSSHMVGSVTPSSRFLAKKMFEHVDFNQCKLIIELGSGDGVFTNIIIENMSPETKLLVFELNNEFYTFLKAKINDPRVEIINDSAEFISKYLSCDEKADCIISSLPLMAFSSSLRTLIVKTAHENLKNDGIYVQFQYSLQSKKLLTSVFNSVSIDFTLKNFPPAFIYTCKKITNN